MKHFRLRLAAGAAAALLALTGCSGGSDAAPQQSGENTQTGAEGQSTQELYPLKVAYSPSLCQAPLHLAVELGFFEEEGILAENVQVDAAHVSEAIGAGQVDVGFGLIGKFLQPIENGLPIQFTTGIHTGCIKILVPGDSDIQSVEDLRGKRIGVPGLADAGTIVAKRALSAAGVSVSERESEVEFLVYDKNDLPQALENGALDAIALGDPTSSIAEREYGLRVLIDTASSPEYADEYCCGAFVSTKLAEERPDIAAAFTRAVQKASVYVQQNPEETARIQLDNDYVTGDIAFNTALLTSYNYMPSVQGGYDAIKLSVEQLSAIGVLKEGTDAAAFTDNCYLFLDDVPDAPEGISAVVPYNTSEAAVPLAESKSEIIYPEDCCDSEPIEVSVPQDCCEDNAEGLL